MSETFSSRPSAELGKLMDSIEMGQITLPDIQRTFVWPNKNIRDLFDSRWRCDASAQTEGIQ